MKCPACGREMFYGTSYLQCSNMLCDYMEEIDEEADVCCVVEQSYGLLRETKRTTQ